MNCCETTNSTFRDFSPNGILLILLSDKQYHRSGFGNDESTDHIRSNGDIFGTVGRCEAAQTPISTFVFHLFDSRPIASAQCLMLYDGPVGSRYNFSGSEQEGCSLSSSNKQMTPAEGGIWQITQGKRVLYSKKPSRQTDGDTVGEQVQILLHRNM